MWAFTRYIFFTLIDFFLFIFLDFWFECINGVFDLNFCRRYWLGKWGRNIAEDTEEWEDSDDVLFRDRWDSKQS